MFLRRYILFVEILTTNRNKNTDFIPNEFRQREYEYNNTQYFIDIETL